MATTNGNHLIEVFVLVCLGIFWVLGFGGVNVIYYFSEHDMCPVCDDDFRFRWVRLSEKYKN